MINIEWPLARTFEKRWKTLKSNGSNQFLKGEFLRVYRQPLAGRGFEPRFTASETDVLPLYDPALAFLFCQRQIRKSYAMTPLWFMAYRTKFESRISNLESQMIFYTRY